MSLLPPAFKDPAFAPLGPPIHRLTVAEARKERIIRWRFAVLEDFETRNHGNADEGCLQEPCMPPTGKEVLTKESVGRLITDLGRRALAGGASSYSNKGSIDAINFDLVREIDERNRKGEAWLRGDFGVDIGREGGDETAVAIRKGEIGQIDHINRQATVGALLRAGQKLDANLAPPSPKLESALNAAQVALAEHLFGEAKKVKDPFEKVTMKLRAKDVERAAQMRAKADALWVACGVPTQPKPKSLRDACREKLVELARRDMPLATNVLRLFGAAGLVDIEDRYLPDLWDQLICPF